MIGLEIGLNLDFPFVAIGEEFFFVVQKFFSRLGWVLEVGPFHDCVNRASLREFR